jgi:hypothetical protein
MEATTPSLTHWTTENGTIVKSCAVGFSMPPSYFYAVLETEEKFTSRHSDIKLAYEEWVNRKARQNIDMQMVTD